MAAFGSLQRIFEKPLPENPTLIESLSSWNQLKTVKPPDQPSFTEIFGELHFRENSHSSSSSFTDIYPQPDVSHLDNNCHIDSSYDGKKSPLLTQKNQYNGCHKSGDSLQLCTEGLGFESSDDVEDMKNDMNEDWRLRDGKVSIRKLSTPENIIVKSRRSRSIREAFPPPISCIGRSGKPRVCFQSYRKDGRFVLKEVRVPTQEFLHACREDGRLKLQFVQPNDSLEEEGEEYEKDSEEESTCTEGEEQDDSSGQ
ncbi:hypothetical protein K2173_013821 [Erythroxylum novogranatense]|uniref:FAF domain-containing protein n=1 Tax=Erythroxylum novogranatense TaxID=1862640 RepID=A0AAV8SCF9_9ROSI|nr:hypothetical protein K2173_013821 [Erythroxylum novogranatense]